MRLAWWLVVAGVVLVVCSSAVAAQVIKQDISIIIDEAGNSSQTYSAQLSENRTVDNITYFLERNPSVVITAHAYTLEEQTENTSLTIFPDEATDTINFTLFFDARTAARNDVQSYTFMQAPPLGTDTIVNISLPIGATLLDINPSAIPTPDMISTTGQRIILSWNMSQTQDVRLAVLYTLPRRQVTIFVIIAAVAAVVVVGIVFLRTRRAKDTLLHTLDPNEYRIVLLLQQGPLTQKELGAQTEFSKSKMSKVLRKLEEKQVIEKRPHLKTNRIWLQKEWR